MVEVLAPKLQLSQEAVLQVLAQAGVETSLLAAWSPEQPYC